MQPRNAKLSWPDGRPRSDVFDDIYFTESDCIAETEHVFIRGNHLPKRIEAGHYRQSTLSIAETGFGTGANLFCLLSIIDRCYAETVQRVHFLSTELFPLKREDLEHALLAFPEFSHYTQQLLAQYPPAIKGMHRFILDKGRFYLTLCMGDAAESLSLLSSPHNNADAWFLDGFAPAKNPAMWSPDLFHAISALSHTRSSDPTTFSTFTIAGFVRRGLQQEGFEVYKGVGYGTKRDMQLGHFVGQSTLPFNTEHPWINDVPQPTPKPPSLPTPWYTLPHNKQAPEHVVIIGAGLAGCTTAEALARRGVRVTLLEKADTICSMASGNRQGALYAKLPVDPTPAGELHLTGLEYTLRLLKIYGLLDGQHADQCGLLQLATSNKEAARQQQLLLNNSFDPAVVRAVTQEEATELANISIKHSGLYFPRAGWVYPLAMCKALISNPLISLETNANVTDITFDEEARQWTVTAQSTYRADAIVVATAHDAKQLPQLNQLPLKPIRGQVSAASINQRKEHSSLETILCGDGYCCPPVDNTLFFGATFDLHKLTDEIRYEDHDYNRSMLAGVAPDLANTLPDPIDWQGKVGFRCSTPDYMPLAGPVPNYDAYVDTYSKLSKDKKWLFEECPAPLHPHFYLNVGHGSKGLITAPLCAEYIASLICGDPLPIHKPMTEALHPARFIIKQLIRNKIGR